MRKKMLVLLAASALLLMACSVSSLLGDLVPQNASEQAAEEPTQTPLSRLSVPTQPGVTAAPTKAGAVTVAPTKAGAATAVPTKASATTAPSSGSPFADALNKAGTATKFRVQFSWIFGGMDSGKYAEEALFDFTGEIDGAKSHLTSKGGMLAMLGGDANTPIEIIEADGKTYMKGISMFGMTDPKQWYISDDNSMTSGFGDFAKPDEYKDWVSGANSGDIKKVRSESLDGQSCDVYLYDIKSLQNQALSGLLGLSGGDKSDFSAIDKGEMDFWLCGDGFVHKFLMDYEGHNKQDPTQKAAMKMTWHAWDFNNASIVVTAPKDAKPMPQ